MQRAIIIGVYLGVGLTCRTSAGELAAGQTRNHVDISVTDVAGLSGVRPVTGGVPIPSTAAPKGTPFVLYDSSGEPVPCQTAVLARWQDESIRWLLLDFQAALAANGAENFRLCWPSNNEALSHSAAVRIRNGDNPSLVSGNLVAAPVDNALLRISNRLELSLAMVDSKGQRFNGVVESVTVDTEGEMRSTLMLAGALRTTSGKRAFSFRMRASVYAGLTKLRLEPQILIDAEEGLFQQICELNLEFVPLDPDWTAIIGGSPGWSGRPTARLRLFQVDDQNYRFEAAAGKSSKAPGWAQIGDSKGDIAIAVKDFWQQWPKSIEVNKDSFKIGLLPRFKLGTFSHMKPWYKYQYWFQDDFYRLRTGQAPRWEIWLDLSGDGPSLAKAANAPLVPAADPAQAVATGVWGYIAPASSRGMEQYDAWAENLFDNAYCHSIKAQRDYGQMNWGDWFGERQVNWGNHEYDTPKHILIQFARTGDPKYFHVGNVAARHTSEVDVVQFVNDDLKTHFEKDLGGRRAYPIRPGMVHQHCVGHVSGFYDVDKIKELYISFGIGNSEHPYLCLDPYNLGHIWTQGMVYNYFLTGDPWMKETVEKIAENLVKLVEDREYNFKTGSHVGRVNGWTMLAIAGAYELDFNNKRVLTAMKLLADDALSAQDRNCGGWLWKLPWGHCNCQTKHVGEAGFISSIRINGLCQYHRLSSDERIAEAVRRGITHLNNDTWMEQHSDWRYTSCPATGPIGQTGVTIAALVNSIRLTGDAEHLRILRKAWDAKFKRLKVAPTVRPGLGKAYSTIMYGCPEAMNLFVNGLE
jgi:hypothetical protein